ncbi:MAG: hypothetical protein JXA36_00745 [Coriobacteriia bacterium]|nr:hypothetical protein [Coriobacteriia bacterium]
MSADERETLQSRIGRWRAYVLAQGREEAQVAVIEDRLRDNASGLCNAGLDAEEAFMVALRRVAAIDDASRDFARVYADELWSEPSATSAVPTTVTEFRVVLACAAAAALAIKVPALFGVELNGPEAGIYARNLSLFVLPFLAAYFVWKAHPGRNVVAGLFAAFIGAAVIANAYPFTPGGATETLAAIHLPIALWLVVGAAYVGAEWRARERRMEYVRFTGEWLVNYALIALGGGVLMALATGIFEALGVDASALISEWVLPCGAVGAVIVAAWLARTRRAPMGGMAPMLARVFTPLFALLLLALSAGVVSAQGIIDIEREALILLDLLLVVVLALLLYALSARGPLDKPGLLDWIQLVLAVCALAVDAVALANILSRLAEYGFSANRMAALGLNLVLLIGLGRSAILQAGVLRGVREFEDVESWHMRYLPVYVLWAALVAVVFPLLFGFA